MPDQMHGPRCGCARCYTHYQLSQRHPDAGDDDAVRFLEGADNPEYVPNRREAIRALDLCDPFEPAPGFIEEP